MRAAAYARRVRFGCVMCASVSICQCSVYISCREIDWTCESLLFFYGDARLEGWAPGPPRLCHLCRACEQQRSCSPGFRRKELHATEGAVEVRRARRRLEDTSSPTSALDFSLRTKTRHSGRCGACRKLSGEARDRLWRSGGRVLRFPLNSVSTPFTHGHGPRRSSAACSEACTAPPAPLNGRSPAARTRCAPLV